MERSKTNWVVVWLLSGCFLIFSMVVIGGITRLTGSGLSITEWNVIMGAVPPLSDADWQEAFDKYRQIPQFKEINTHFQLDDFKEIFWWEFIHRLVGRLIGVVFLVPFIYFVIKRRLSPAMIRKSLFLFLLGALQGFLGWYMVKSGLTELTSVSHVRLAIHLITAFITFGFTFWFAMQLMEKQDPVESNGTVRGLSGLLLGVTLVQIVYGALVAGLHAGKMFNTFPLMNGQVFPVSFWISEMGVSNLFQNPATIQFVHRFLAFAILFFVGWIVIEAGKNAQPVQRKSVKFLMYAVLLQFLLGVLTILYHAPVLLSSIHQIGAFFLFMAVLFTRFSYRKPAYSTAQKVSAQ